LIASRLVSTPRYAVREKAGTRCIVRMDAGNARLFAVRGLRVSESRLR